MAVNKSKVVKGSMSDFSKKAIEKYAAENNDMKQYRAADVIIEAGIKSLSTRTEGRKQK